MPFIEDDKTADKPCKFGYIYKITNLINGKIYVGKRQSSTFDQYYWGSGIYITRAIKKYGKENFDRQIIEWCYSLDEIVDREIYWIYKLNAQNPDIGYNLSSGGIGSSGCKWSEESKNKLRRYRGQLSPNWGRKFSEEHRKKLSDSHKGKELSEEHKKKIGKANEGRNVSQETRRKISEKLIGKPKWTEKENPFYGKHWTDEQKVSNGAKIREALSSQETRLKMSESHKGKALTEEQKIKISIANTGKKRTTEQCQKMSDIRKGKPKSIEQQKRLQTVCVGRIWIHNDEGKTKMIYPEEFIQYECFGWLKGRK